jgi:hypothetical protein
MDNVKMDLTETRWGAGVCRLLIWLRTGLKAGTWKHGCEPKGSAKGMEYLN